MVLVLFISSLLAPGLADSTTSENPPSAFPTVSLSTPVISGLTVTIGGSARTSAAASSILSVQWIWGDGESTTGPFPQSHTYAKSGTYTVTVVVTDGAGLRASAFELVTPGSSTQSDVLLLSILAVGALVVATFILVTNGRRRKGRREKYDYLPPPRKKDEKGTKKVSARKDAPAKEQRADAEEK